MVSFKHEGQTFIGKVNRITRRAPSWSSILRGKSMTMANRTASSTCRYRISVGLAAPVCPKPELDASTRLERQIVVERNTGLDSE